MNVSIRINCFATQCVGVKTGTFYFLINLSYNAHRMRTNITTIYIVNHAESFGQYSHKCR